MVQYKRKPVKTEPLPPFLNDDTEVWVINETGEVFTDYERFLNRRDFYSQRVFTCESTGHSGYTFFEAMKSETEAEEEIDSIFPEGLRARVLEYVQFQTTARMDDLVNQVYDHFREHYMVGDRVALDTEGGKRYGVIKNMTDTSRLHTMYGALNEDFRSYTYIMQMDDNGEELTRYKASELQRDRRVYSKLILKQFLRSAISREPWHGAAWMVKDHLAKRYDIPTKIPDAKTREAVIAAKKAANAANVVVTPRSDGPSPHLNFPTAGHQQMNGVRPPMQGNGQAQTNAIQHLANRPPHPPHMNGTLVSGPPNVYPGPPPIRYSGPPPIQYSQPPPYQYNNHPPHVGAQINQNLPPHLSQHLPPPGSGGLPVTLPFQNNFMQYQTLTPPNNMPQHPPPPPPRPFEPIKYPIDDLRIKQPRTSVTRPPLKFFSDDVPEGVEPPENRRKTGILMKSVGPLLCIWETLNVHDTIYSLDSFTIDDFVEAMGFTSDEVECELLVEAHCAVLKQYVSSSGKMLIQLPSMIDEEESDDEETSKEATPEPEPPKRTTRSSLRKSEANEIVAKPRTPTPEPPKQTHKAAEFVADFDWVEQCKIRNFRDGGWQAILVGLLHHLSYHPSHKEDCDEILAQLVPPDEEPSVENIASNYQNLDVNLRISALDIALRLTVTTEQFREQLQIAAQEMTTLRKEKIEYQRKRKELADEMFKLDIERKIQLPLNDQASPTDTKDTPDVSMTDVNDAKEEEEEGSDSDAEPQTNTRKMRNAAKQTKRKRNSEVAKKEKAKKAKAEAAKTKQQKEWEKLLDAIEKKKTELRDCEAKINDLDDDLREASVHRSKILGKDRFLNKYYWFEHNGMPFGGVPHASTAEYGYANGRVWVQGPDELELKPNLEEPALSQDMAEFGWTVPMRKEREEGSTHLNFSSEWGYYDDPEDIEKLMAWLDERGTREKVLRKELLIFQSRIAEYMRKMKAHLAEADRSEMEVDEEDEAPTTRSTRNKASAPVEKTSDEPRAKCLLWTNSMMREREGFNHSEEYEPPKRTKKGTAKVTKGKGRK